MTNQQTSELVALVQALVNIPTENNPPTGSECLGQEYVAAFLRKIGMEVNTFSPEDVPGFFQNPAFLQGRSYENRNNVVAIWRGNSDGKSVVLSSHMDVAPKEPLNWTVCEPYESIVVDGKIYGRGTSDMKGGMACALMALKLLKQNGFQPAGDIIFESVVDEEFAGGNGTIASRMMGYNADFAIVLEPSGLKVCAANVGGLMIRVELTGSAGMPYTGEKIPNIAYRLADLLKVIELYEADREQADCPKLWEQAIQRRKIIITKIKAGEVQPHGQLSVPDQAWIELSVQTYPGESEEGVLREFSQYISSHLPDSGNLRLVPQYHYIEPSLTDPNNAYVFRLNECLNRYVNSDVTIAPFPCDAFAFTKYAQTPTVIFGPEGGCLHAPDEWVDIHSLTVVTQTLMDFITEQR